MNTDTNITVIDPPAVANLMNTGRFNQMLLIAQTMATASLIPDHMLGKKNNGKFEYFSADEIRANCFLVVNQAFRWGMDPFAVLPETYVVGGKLGFQGKLVAAVINGLANLDERLSYSFEGQPGTDDFTVTVSGRIRGENKPRTVTVRVGDVKTDNQMWRKDPEQKLVYTGATKWARRHSPEVILGILTDDDVDAIEIRQTEGRVVEEGNPWQQQAAAPAAEAKPAAAPAEKRAKPAPKPKAEPKAEPKPEPTPEPEPEPEQEQEQEEEQQDADWDPEPEVDMPEHEDMVRDVTSAVEAAKISPQTAAKRYREAGLVPEGMKIADMSREQFFVLWKGRETALVKKGEEAP